MPTTTVKMVSVQVGSVKIDIPLKEEVAVSELPSAEFLGKVDWVELFRREGGRRPSMEIPKKKWTKKDIAEAIDNSAPGMRAILSVIAESGNKGIDFESIVKAARGDVSSVNSIESVNGHLTGWGKRCKDFEDLLTRKMGVKGDRAVRMIQIDPNYLAIVKTLLG